ncbi:MAG: tyrosine--tRNA ligase [Nanoarchaeota archaeon]
MITEIFPEGSDINGLKKVKFGIDPTFPRLHLGHLVPLRVVKKLQEQGKDITIVLGTFTAQMGDPSGRDQTRPILSAEEVEKNAEKILMQVRGILNPGFKVFKNGDVFNKMTVPELMKIVSDFTIQQMTHRNAFSKRIESNTPIAIHELIVPILQGTDSVKLESEIEIGGTDQLFNFQVTRKLQEINGQKPEICILAPIINGTNGIKMSKSLGNCIFLDEDPTDVFGKCMSVSDDVMNEWIPLLTDENKESNPMSRKKKMAFDIVEQLFDKTMAEVCLKQFEDRIQNKEIPDEIEEIRADDLLDAVVKIRGCSKSDARRLIDQGGVKIDDEKADEKSVIKTGQIIKVGKRDFGQII